MCLLVLLLCLGAARAQLHYRVSCYECTGHGADHSLPECLNRHKLCHDDEICQINYNGHETQTKCRKLVDCRREVEEHAGALQPLCTQGGSYAHHSCQVCCSDDTCTSDIINKLTTGTTTSNSHSVWDHLQGSCVDQLEGNQCQTLHTSPADCNNRVSLRVCPQTCGLCSLYAGQSGCHDTVADNGCAALQVSEDVCSTATAMHICPVTCNMCEALLDDRIHQALAQQWATTMPPTPPPTTTDPLPGACEVLKNQSCDVLHGLCQFVHCPVECHQCDVTTTTAPSPMPDVTIASQCVDTLQSVNCSEVIGVCSSSLLASYCPQYCGAC